MLTDITPADISRHKTSRKDEGASGKTINLEIGTLRAIMRKHRLWANLQPDVKMMRTREDVGRALTPDEVHRVLTACRNNRSRFLYPAVLLSLHTGIRLSELRHLHWRQVDLIEKHLTVGKAKPRVVRGEKSS